MLLSFETQRIRSLCESGGAASKAFGPELAAVLRNRLADLRAAETLDELIACEVKASPEAPYHLEISIGNDLKLIFVALSDDLQEVGLEQSHDAVRIKLVAIEGGRDV